jgi:hypothetical protein
MLSILNAITESVGGTLLSLLPIISMMKRIDISSKA